MKCRSKIETALAFAFRNSLNFVRKTVTIIENLYCPTILIEVNQQRY